MSKTNILSVTRTPIHAVIEDYGAMPVLLAALKALVRRKVDDGKSLKADLAQLDDRLRRDIGLPPAELRHSFPIRSP